VKFRVTVLMAAVSFAAAAQGPKIAIISFQEAVLSTGEGQKAVAAMKTKFDPKKAAIEKKQADLTAMQERLQKGGPGVTDAVKAKMQNDLAVGGRSLNHDVDDLNAEVQEEQGKVMQVMAAKMGEIIKGYATKNGYTVVLDVSGQTTPVLWAAPSVNITQAIVKLYDAAHPVGAAPAPGKK
jgi:Skp family chaperone for outer membrane proteins